MDWVVIQTKRMVQQEAAELFQTDRYLYRRIFNIPKGSPLVDDLSDLEIAVELDAHRRYTLAVNGKEGQERIESDPAVEETINAIEEGATFEESMPEEFRQFFEDGGSLDFGKFLNNDDDQPAEDAP